MATAQSSVPRVTLIAVLAAALAAPTTLRAEDTPAPLDFAAPVKVNDYGWGFEPSIDVDSAGTLYVTAHKGSITHEGTRLSSFLWFSQDSGSTWREMPSPVQLHEKMFALEGDIALDARDRLYYVDTYAGDDWISRWSQGPSWDYSGVAVTASAFDDRPWIAAHGDGVVYLVTTDVVTHSHPADLPAAPNPTAWAITPVFYRSTDGGLSWTLGHPFPGAVFCGVAASPLDDVSLAVACATRTASGYELVVHRSGDRGTSWTRDAVFTLAAQPAPFVSAAYDSAGNLYVSFIDGVPNGNKVYVARRTAGAWSVQDVTPFNGSFREAWITAREPGEAGIAFYSTELAPSTQTSEWHVYAGVSADAAGPSPAWSFAMIDPLRVIRGAYAPPDFLQCVMAPDGTLFVAYSRESAADVLHAPPPDFDHDIFVARQTRGPNLP